MDEDINIQPYSMSQALQLLHKEVTAELDRFSVLERGRRWQCVLHQFQHGNVKAVCHWSSCAIVLIAVLLLFTAYAFGIEREASGNSWLVAEAILLLLIMVGNVCLSVVSAIQESQEFIRLMRNVLTKLSSCMAYNTWNSLYFPSVHAPSSPCITLQWTVRDKQVINLPTPLLVKGDIILLRPAQTAPAKCKWVTKASTAGATTVLNGGDVFSSGLAGDSEGFTMPQSREPLKASKFVLLETPYVHCVRRILEDTGRPASILDHEKYYIVTQWLEQKVIPAVLVVMVVTNVLRYIYMDGHVGHWTEMILVLQIHTVIPLVPLTLPVMWLLVNFYGQARVFTAFEAAKGAKPLCDDSFDTDSSISVDEARVDLQWRQVLEWFNAIVLGRAQVVTRKINITHILGSFTTLCCVDKKGILSYPNPSPEKIFLLRRTPKLPDPQASDPPMEQRNGETRRHKRSYSDPGGISLPSVVEVLDLSVDPKKKSGIHFDDPAWKEHINSLKPLGLNILVNTCNLETASWYDQFTDHVASAALEKEETVAVVNRRCLCGLAREIGFSEAAMDIFQLENTLGLYRQLSAEATTKERLQQAKSFIQHKVPMPHMVSVIVREKVSGCCQLLSQGTADILLHCCSDYWNGTDLALLTENDRKRILDFYHRTSMGAYCSAFSYRPVSQTMGGHAVDAYMELPDNGNWSTLVDQRHSIRSVDQDLELMADTRQLWDGLRSFSADSLLESSTDSLAGLIQTRCNQIFIGMVTMQYQARQDFVQLIDKLEGACIRFVHFSQENEVRSRVFSEKMGLEAGWNCHISLLGEKQYLSGTTANTSGPGSFSQGDVSHRTSRYSSRHSTESYTKGDNPVLTKKFKQYQEPMASRSHSAPSIVNLASSQVKFETKVKTAIVSPRKVKRIEPSILPEEEELLPLNPAVDSDEHFEIGLELEEDLNWDSDDGESRQASSYVTENTEDSLTGAFSNRAKLPQGIENIRPHLRSVDNVPLLVNLFTDCTSETTKEMMSIMQEHGEVVLCVGSSTNVQNIPIFLQADCSLALEPECPQVCLHDRESCVHWSQENPTPLQLASCLLSISCPLLISKVDNIGIIHLTAEARCHLMATRSCFYYICCCSLSISCVQLLASLVQFPPVLAAHHILWLCLFIVPLLGITLMGNPVDARVMSIATRKNKEHITSEMFLRFIGHYLVRFLPPSIVALFCYGLTLHSFCQTHTATLNGTSCAIYNSMSSSTLPDETWYEKYSGGIVLAQNILLFLLVFYFEIISVSFVHWTDHLWQQVPATNKLWLTIVPLLFVCQVLFSVCDIFIRNDAVRLEMALSDVHPAVWAVGLSFPVLMLIVNELVKHQEIKLAVRLQKRARLDFGTKLGMNSPF